MQSHWTAIGLDAQFPAETAHPVVLEDFGLAVWRSAEGELQAWEDRCPHRGMRLSFGFVRGDALTCLYHGWSFGAEGQCRRIPAHPELEPPQTICATAYPVATFRGLVFTTLRAAGAAPGDDGGFWARLRGAFAPEKEWFPIRSIFATADHDAARSALANGALGVEWAAVGDIASAVDADWHGHGRVTLGLQRVSGGKTAIHASSDIADPALRAEIAGRLTRLRRGLESRQKGETP